MEKYAGGTQHNNAERAMQGLAQTRQACTIRTNMA